jgi:hypothetical protein
VIRGSVDMNEKANVGATSASSTGCINMLHGHRTGRCRILGLLHMTMNLADVEMSPASLERAAA